MRTGALGVVKQAYQVGPDAERVNLVAWGRTPSERAGISRHSRAKRCTQTLLFERPEHLLGQIVAGDNGSAGQLGTLVLRRHLDTNTTHKHRVKVEPRGSTENAAYPLERFSALGAEVRQIARVQPDAARFVPKLYAAHTDSRQHEPR